MDHEHRTRRAPTISGLTVTRKLGEFLMIGDEITLEVVDYSRGHVTLRVAAPPSLSILRLPRQADGDDDR
jgi:hypothetical protein